QFTENHYVKANTAAGTHVALLLKIAQNQGNIYIKTRERLIKLDQYLKSQDVKNQNLVHLLQMGNTIIEDFETKKDICKDMGPAIHLIRLAETAIKFAEN